MRKGVFTSIAGVLLAACLLASAFAQPGAEGATEPKKESALSGTLMMSGAPREKFEASWANPGGWLRIQLFRRLLMCDKDLVVVGTDLAKSWSVSPDALTYTFVLRDDVKWQDGVKMTGEDVGWSIRMALKSVSINNVFATSFAKIDGADDFKAGKTDSLKGVTVNGNTITIKLVDRVAAFPLVMAQWPPYPKHLLEKEEPAKLHLAAFWEKPIGNGPYMITEVVPANYAVMEPFKDYYGPKPKIAKVLFQYFDTPEQTMLAFKSDKIHYTNSMSLADVNEILKNPNYKATTVPIFYIRYLQSNLNSNPKIADPRLRKALMYAIDRDAIANKLFPGQATVLNSKIPPGSVWYSPEPEKYAFDPAKAKQLLAQSGYNVATPIRLAYYYADQQTLDLIETIKFYWEQVGLKVETSILKGNLLELIYETRPYDFLYAGLSAMALEEVYGIFGSTHVMGQKLGLGDKSVDPLIDELFKEGDQAKRKAIVQKIEAWENQALQQMPLFALQMYVLEHKNLKKPAIYGNEWFNYDYKLQEWEIVQ